MGTLLDWFGSSRAQIWHKLSAEIGGSYSPGTWRKHDRIQVVHEHWTITLDTFMAQAEHGAVTPRRRRVTPARARSS